MSRLRWLAACALLLPGLACAWGAEGHRIVALIAERELTPQVRQKVAALLAQDTSPLTDHDIAGAAVWADKFRDDDEGNRSLTQRWHYANIDLHQKDFAAACGGDSRSCVVDKIEQFSSELRSPGTPPRERLLALKFLLHLVGDVHQPLHVSDDHDGGGNAKQVNGTHGMPISLHSYWDTYLVRRLGRDAHKSAHKLGATISDADRQHWKTGSPRDWAMETFAIASDFVYADLPAPADEVYVLSSRYEAEALDKARLQLRKAGVRLAVLLNAALSN